MSPTSAFKAAWLLLKRYATIEARIRALESNPPPQAPYRCGQCGKAQMFVEKSDEQKSDIFGLFGYMHHCRCKACDYTRIYEERFRN